MSPDPAPVPLVRMGEISRRFGAVRANDRVCLEVQRGTIHGLVGENGAGKSTLMRILYGLDRPDAGRILFDGRPVRFGGPRDALALGIGMVHQHFMLVRDLSVLDNVILGDEPCRGPLLDRRAARARLEEKAAAALSGLDLDRPVGDLPLGQQQRVEILKLLYRDARLLILDEPTAVLSPGEVGSLFEELRRLKAGGRTLILITHKLREVMMVTDRVSVMRQGRMVLSVATGDTTPDRLAREIVGSDMETAPAALSAADASAEPAPAAAAGPGLAEVPAVLAPAGAAAAAPAVLELQDVRAAGPGGVGGLRGVSLTVRAGEILAVAGVEGNGQSELARVVAGRVAPDSGRVLRDGVPAPAGRAAPSAPALTGYIPEDRLRDGLLLSMDVEANLLLGRQREARFRRGPLLDERAVRAHARRLVAGQDIRPPDPELGAGLLSGGNQQKVVVAREVEESPRLIVAAHPTRGLDLKATAAVHRVLRARRDAGAAVLLITAELDEARSLGDRMVVLYEGRIAGEVPPRAVTDGELGLLMTGGRPS